MFRERSEQEYESEAAGGVRHLFTLGQYEFQDAIDADGRMRHVVLQAADGDGESDEASVYEIDRDTMYEFMARFLAGEYEMEEYDLDHSPAHDALLDVLEIAAARARAGESDFSWDDFDQAETELMDDDGPDDADQRP